MMETNKAVSKVRPDEQLWQRWRDGERVDLAEFLAGFRSLQPTELVAVLLIDQSERWRRGERIPAETYLRRFPSLDAEVEAVVELAYGEFLLREELGEKPAFEEYLQRFPRYQAQLDLHRALQRKSASAGSSGTAKQTPPASAAERTPGPTSSRDPGVLPRSFGRYTLRKLLGKGGMGRVYLAHDPQLDRLVALKMPNPVEDVGWRERFLTEARAAATLTHPNVCPVYEVGEVDTQPYLTMAFIEGETLAAKLTREGPFNSADAVELVATVARAMHEAHRRGIIHRDLKPANVMLDSVGRPVIMDFGLAIRSTGADDLRMTLTGVALGTPAYMPPEQAGGDQDAIGPPADVYSLGVILFELVTGRTPFRAKTFGKLLAQIERDPPPSPSSLNPNVDLALEALILTALAKAPNDRFFSAGDFADALERHQQGDRAGLISRYSQQFVTTKSVTGFQSDSTATLPSPRSKRGWWLLGSAALIFLLTALGAGIYIETDYGQIVVQLSDPNAKVDVRVNGQEVTLTAVGGKPIRVRAGKNQKLEVSGTDFETIADSFNLKRGDIHIARVTLKPRLAMVKKGRDPIPVDPPKKEPIDLRKKTPSDPPKKEPIDPPKKVLPPKPVPFPEKSTLIEIAGWQILTDANRDEMQAWLDARKKDKHSVIWLDAYPIGDRPVFSAIAALDERETKWLAFLAVKASEFGSGAILKRFNVKAYLVRSMGGYTQGADTPLAMLMVPGNKVWGFIPDCEDSLLEKWEQVQNKAGNVFHVLRPFPFGSGRTLYSVYSERRLDKGPYAVNLSSKGLADEFAKMRAANRRPHGVAGSAAPDGVRFAMTTVSNDEKTDWLVDVDLPAGKLKTRAEELAQMGFRPEGVSCYGYAGVVRYCVLWVKDKKP